MDSLYLIDKSFIEEYDLSGEALAVAICIKMKCQNKEAALSAGLLEYYIFGYKNSNKKRRDLIVDGFNELINKDILTIKGKLKDHVIVCDVSKIITVKKENFYISISKDEFFTIINLDECKKNYDLLKFFMNVVGTFESCKNMKDKYKFKIGTMSQTYLSSVCNVSIPTLIKYNKILTENNIMYIVNRKAYKLSCNTGKLYSAMSNVYSRYKDRKLCEEYLTEKGFVKKEKSYINITNEMRSLSQKYNYFKRTYENTICEDIEKVMRAYNAAKQWNEYAKQDYENAIENGKKVEEPEYKDLSIFDKYDLTV